VTAVLIIKTGALGDVLRTTSILPGLAARYADLDVTWLVAPAAVDLVRLHPRVARVVALDTGDAEAVRAVTAELAGRAWQRVLSFDDEEPLCRLARAVGGDGADGVLSGAYLADDGTRRYTPDVAPWFDMGLLSVHGKAAADRMKLENDETHPAIFARMLGVEPGEPELVLTDEARARAAALLDAHPELRRPWIGLNTGAGGRWASKRLPVDRTVALALELDRRLPGGAGFLVLGGPEEAARNERILAGIAAAGIPGVDAGTGHALLEFAALVERLDLLVSSDSLAMHVGIARRVPVLAFFAPTPAAEIELYGRGETVSSTAPDAGSYRPDADTATLTTERLAEAALRVLAGSG
jgi:heptosyltransferase-2